MVGKRSVVGGCLTVGKVWRKGNEVQENHVVVRKGGLAIWAKKEKQTRKATPNTSSAVSDLLHLHLHLRLCLCSSWTRPSFHLFHHGFLRSFFLKILTLFYCVMWGLDSHVALTDVVLNKCPLPSPSFLPSHPPHERIICRQQKRHGGLPLWRVPRKYSVTVVGHGGVSYVTCFLHSIHPTHPHPSYMMMRCVMAMGLTGS